MVSCKDDSEATAAIRFVNMHRTDLREYLTFNLHAWYNCLHLSISQDYTEPYYLDADACCVQPSELDTIAWFKFVCKQFERPPCILRCPLSGTEVRLRKHIIKLSRAVIDCVVSIVDPAVRGHQPFSLKLIAAASSVRVLGRQSKSTLMRVNTLVHNSSMYVRVGPPSARRHYKFANIVKHYIYEKLELSPPLVKETYFENVAIRAVPFCVKCGIIANAMCPTQNRMNCGVCLLLQYFILFSAHIEHTAHTCLCEI